MTGEHEGAAWRVRLWGGRAEVRGARELARAAASLGLLRAAALAGEALARAGRPRTLRAVERLAARATARLLGLRLELDGLELVNPRARYVVVALHEGLIDPVALEHLPLDLRFVVREELFGWPALGPYLRASGHVMVSPEDGAPGLRRLLHGAAEAAAAGESLAVFAQGSVLGIETDLWPGAFAAARALGWPVLPVAITGTARAWEHPFAPRVRFGVRVSLRVLEPVPTETLRERDLDEVRRDVGRRLKAAALDGRMAAPRRFVPARDGYWDGYAYRIDPAFAALHADVGLRRRRTAGRS